MTSRRLLHHTIFLKKDLYLTGSRQLRTQILDEIQRDFHKPRNTIKRLFYRARSKAQAEHFEQRPGRPRSYDDKTIWWLETLYLSMDQMNSKSMQQALPFWLKKNSNPQLTFEIQAKLVKMSHSTIDRLLKRYKKTLDRKKRSGTKRGHIRLYKDRVPLHRFEDKISRPGSLQADTVAHCGGSMSGHFIWTLNITDVYTGWCEQRAVWAKHQDKVLNATSEILAQLPFKAHSIHTDNGWEFLNELFVSHFEKERDLGQSNIFQTRSRAYYKNDHAHVEQKNSTHVRRLLGYERFENFKLIEPINDIYKNEHSLFMNFFVPQRKLVEKVRSGNKTFKRYDKPKTPYQRLLDSNILSDVMRQKLGDLYETLDPFHLNRQIQEKIRKLEKQLNQKQESTDPSSTPQAA
jgi:transposase